MANVVRFDVDMTLLLLLFEFHVIINNKHTALGTPFRFGHWRSQPMLVVVGLYHMTANGVLCQGWKRRRGIGCHSFKRQPKKRKFTGLGEPHRQQQLGELIKQTECKLER